MLAALIVAAAWLGPLALGETFALRDQVTWALPARAWFHDAVMRGGLPEWWSAVGLGVPFAANPVNGVTYPPTWIVAIGPAAWASDFLYVAHLAWLAAGTARLARRLGAERLGATLAGVTAALCGFSASALCNGVPLFGLAWMPWVLAAVDDLAHATTTRERTRAAASIAALWAMQLLATVPGAIDTAVVAVGWIVARSARRWPSLAALGGGFVAALPLAAVALLPALHLLGASERHAGLSFDDATVWSLHPMRLLELMVPPRLGLAQPNEAAGHALGPTWAFSVYLSAPIVAFAVVACVRERALRGVAVVAALMLVVACGRYTPLYALYRAIVLPERLARYPEKHLGAVVVLMAALAGVGFARSFARRPRWLAALVVATLAVHLAVEGWVTQPLVPRAALARVPALLAPVAAEAARAPVRPRLYRPPGLPVRSTATTPAEQSVAERDTGLENAASPYGFAHVPGFDAALDPRWHQVWDAGAARGADLLARFDVRYIVLPPVAATRAGFVVRNELGGLALAENPQRRPRAFVDERPCTVVEHAPESIELGCDGPGRAVLLDAFADGWRATVDGAPAPIERFEDVARAVAIGPGRHVVGMRYRTPGLRAGALVSTAAWLLLALLARLLGGDARRRRS